jgi:hypothetical protein
MRLAYLLASTLLATAACASDATVEGELPFEGEADGLSKADAVTVDVTELEFADISNERLQRGGTFIITSKSAWKRVMGTLAPKEIDFSKEWVAFFGTGVKNTGGYGARITSVSLYANAGAIVLETKATSPGDDCIVTQAFTNPHHVVKFAIPAPRPAFALAASSSEVRRCSPTNAERLEQLADSRVSFDAAKAKHDNSYVYTRDFQSFSGFGFQTTITVEKGIVIERTYTAQHISGGDSTQWTETGADVGSHDEGHPAVTVDALYEECATTVLSKNDELNWINFSTDDNNFLQACTFTPKNCQDDCTRGPVLSTLQF